MAFRFGFANGDDDADAGDGDNSTIVPVTNTANAPPAAGHELKDLVGTTVPAAYFTLAH